MRRIGPGEGELRTGSEAGDTGPEGEGSSTGRTAEEGERRTVGAAHRIAEREGLRTAGNLSGNPEWLHKRALQVSNGLSVGKD